FFIINYSLITDNFFLCWISSGGEPQRRFSVPLARRQPSRCTHGGLMCSYGIYNHYKAKFSY
ncbi:MAG: hypothetical protein FWD13_13600, partial [Treponema sp.]|nr:hypothetical protein [Treponema sp.]